MANRESNGRYQGGLDWAQVPADGGGAGGGAAPGRRTLTERSGPSVDSIARAVMRYLRAQAGDGAVAEGAEAAVARATADSGASLPAGPRARFEASLGVDLGAVRVHTGAASAEAAAAVGARAFAVGQDIHFGAGEYDPASSAGQHLLAHEVAHTAQHSPGPQCKLAVSSPGDAAEVEADRAADAMVAGQPASVSGASGVLLHRDTPEGAPAAEDKMIDSRWRVTYTALLGGKVSANPLQRDAGHALRVKGLTVEPEGAEGKTFTGLNVHSNAPATLGTLAQKSGTGGTVTGAFATGLPPKISVTLDIKDQEVAEDAKAKAALARQKASLPALSGKAEAMLQARLPTIGQGSYQGIQAELLSQLQGDPEFAGYSASVKVAEVLKGEAAAVFAAPQPYGPVTDAKKDFTVVVEVPTEESHYTVNSGGNSSQGSSSQVTGSSATTKETESEEINKKMQESVTKLRTVLENAKNTVARNIASLVVNTGGVEKSTMEFGMDNENQLKLNAKAKGSLKIPLLGDIPLLKEILPKIDLEGTLDGSIKIGFHGSNLSESQRQWAVEHKNELETATEQAVKSVMENEINAVLRTEYEQKLVEKLKQESSSGLKLDSSQNKSNQYATVKGEVEYNALEPRMVVR